VFGIIFIAVGTVLQVYVFWRAASVPLVARHVARSLLVGAGMVLWLGFVLGRVLGHGGTGALEATLELIGMTWMGCVFLASVCLLAIEAVTAGGMLMPRHAPCVRGWALAVAAVLSLVALIQGLRPPVVQDYAVQLSGLPKEREGTVLVAMSDLHLGAMLGRSWLEARVDQVQALRPDLVVLLGDLFEGHGSPPGELVEVLRRLSAPLGVWAVPGNHEYYGGGDNASLIREAGIELLLNRAVEVRHGIVLAGVDDLTSLRRAGRQDDLIAPALSNRPPGATVLLSHTPWQADEAARMGVGLMLCGHTHGGQIWPFGYLVRRAYPLLEGRYQVGDMTVIVCRGTGTWGPRMRLWRTGEILRVVLRGKEG
jgi:uncharacterized protein